MLGVGSGRDAPTPKDRRARMLLTPRCMWEEAAWRVRWRRSRGRQPAARRSVVFWTLVVVIIAIVAAVISVHRLRWSFRRDAPGSVTPAPVNPVPAPTRGQP